MGKIHHEHEWTTDDEILVIDNMSPPKFDCADVSTFNRRQGMKIEEMRAKEDEVSKAINEAREAWVNKYGIAPDTRMSCFQVVELLEKLGLVNND